MGERINAHAWIAAVIDRISYVKTSCEIMCRHYHDQDEEREEYGLVGLDAPELADYLQGLAVIVRKVASDLDYVVRFGDLFDLALYLQGSPEVDDDYQD